MFVCFFFKGIKRKVANLMPQIKLINYNHKSRRTGDITLALLSGIVEPFSPFLLAFLR